MDAFLGFLLFVLLAVIILVLPFIALTKARRALALLEEMTKRLTALEREVKSWQQIAQRESRTEAPAPARAPAGVPVVSPAPAAPEHIPPVAPAAMPAATLLEAVAPPPPVLVAETKPRPLSAASIVPPAMPAPLNPEPPVSAKPPALPSASGHRAAEPAQPATPPPPHPQQRAAINWEQFMGAKLFAWIGGLALFLGVAFFVKYSFDRNLIPPAARAAFGFLTGLGLLGGGALMKRRATAVTAQTLSATGILILYAVTFACHAFFHFPVFNLEVTFGVMSVITVTAFVFSVHMDALAVAILGMAGGFLTPVLLSTGEDAPLVLFSYIGFLDLGLLAVVLRQRWNSLPILATIGTVLMQFGWLVRFFDPGHYEDGNRTLVPMAILLSFQALFLAVAAVARGLGKPNRTLSGVALSMAAPALLFAFSCLAYPAIGQRPVLLFGYALAVDALLLALVFLDRALAATESAAGAVILALLACWSASFLRDQETGLALGVFLLFGLLHLAAPLLLRRAGATKFPWPIHFLPVIAVPFGFLALQPMTDQPALFFGAVLVVNLAILLAGLIESDFVPAQGAAGGAAFLLLAVWTTNHLEEQNLNLTLALYAVFALLNTAGPIVLQRWRKVSPPWWTHLFPSLALLLVLLPLFKLSGLSFFLWPIVLLIDALAIGVAALSGALLPVIAVLVLTMATLGVWIFRIPSELTGLPTALLLIGVFAVCFSAAAMWLCRRVLGNAKPGEAAAPNLFGDIQNPANLAVQIPVLSAAMPFALLIMMVERLPLENPSSVFGVALGLVTLLLGMTVGTSIEVLPMAGLLCVAALEETWREDHFNHAHAGLPLAWHLVFYAVFTVFPFLFHQRFENRRWPWAAAALAGPLHFLLVHPEIRAAYPALRGAMGLVPAAFALPALAGVAAILKRTPAADPARNSQLAWFGGAALFFITLIFPVQFERQWITIGWALEGAALCWLFQRVPHRGLRAVGLALLAAAFARLALNPAVLSYHARAAFPIFNWYLYAYGLVSVALFAGARFLTPPRNLVQQTNVPPFLCTFGTILAFLLVNIEVADYFTKPGAAVLTLDFSENLARDMSFSIAWALFALLLLILGIGKRLAAVRYASIALLGVTVLKLFFHDLSQLDQLYRIGALVGVAIIAIFSSFLYQRFLAVAEKGHGEGTE